LNAKKQLGTYNTTPSVAPIKINGFTNVKKVAVGKDYTCFINSANQLYCLGSNSSLKTGLDGSDSTIIGTPTLSPYFTKVLDVSTGEETTCAIDEIGAARSVKCWGLIEKRWERDPQLVTNTPHDIIKISLGAQPSLDISIRPESHACGTTESGDVYCWGGELKIPKGLSWYSNLPDCQQSSFVCKSGQSSSRGS
jgi:alpha-tubulin suppressor-like RCC1 family protein